jgi:hypothetical protein
MTRDWHEWHRAYDRLASPLAQRLEFVQQCIRDAFDVTPPGPIQLVSMCAGQGRDVLGVLADHPRAGDVHGRLVELDPDLALIALEAAPVRIDVLVADAGMSTAYEDAVPADVVLVCGVFGNITDSDIQRTVSSLPMLCAPGAHVVWTRHRREPDLTRKAREWFAAAGFDEVAWIAPGDSVFGIGLHRFAGQPAPFRPHVRLFEFVGFDALDPVCEQCGFSYNLTPVEVLTLLGSDADAFVAEMRRYDDVTVRRRPAPEVWSPLEYACHVRDVLAVQRERIALTLREHEPEFEPMGRDERVVRDRYNEQDPSVVANELIDANDALVLLLQSLDHDQWQRRGWYNYPERELRTIQWIGTHTVHELLHHRTDIGTLA